MALRPPGCEDAQLAPTERPHEDGCSGTPPAWSCLASLPRFLTTEAMGKDEKTSEPPGCSVVRCRGKPERSVAGRRRCAALRPLRLRTQSLGGDRGTSRTFPVPAPRRLHHAPGQLTHPQTSELSRCQKAVKGRKSPVVWVSACK